MGRWLALGAATAGALLVGMLLILPFLHQGRVLPASIPQPKPLFPSQVIPVKGGQEACMENVVADERSEVGYIKVGTARKPPVPLTFRMTGEDYRVEARYPPIYEDNEVLTFTVEPPETPRRVEICVRNDGRRVIDLYAADDRTRTRGATFVDGERVFPNFEMSFTERQGVSFGRRFATTAHRLSTFRPGGPWLPWTLVILMLAGVPLALVAALFRSAVEDEDEDAEA